MCGMNTRGAHLYGVIFILEYTSLKIVFLLHKTVLTNFPMATTVGLVAKIVHYTAEFDTYLLKNLAMIWVY